VIATRLVVALLAVVALTAVPAPLAAQTPSAQPLPEPEGVTAGAAVLWDPQAEQVLWGREEATGVPMASTTKIMTTLLALEAGTVDDSVTVSQRAAQAGGAGLGLRAGQQLPMRSLLAGLMLRSGNDAAIAVAEHVAGSEDAFVRRMNARARELALGDVEFLNPSGLTEDRRHRASPLALARLTRVAMAHPEFAQWAGARRLSVPDLGALQNRNELLPTYPGAIGVKTGYLAHAGYALVAAATRDGLTLYAVVLASNDNFGDAKRLLDWGWAHYRLAQPAVAGQPLSVYRWADTETPLVAHVRLSAAVRRDRPVLLRVSLTPTAERPLPARHTLGTAELVEGERVVASSPLRTTAALAAPPSAEGAKGAGRAVHDAVRALMRTVPLDAAA
jgi:D-alanyl-D-alanine carboxypeptidase (penicillin-binding protein 5/6)